jgi:hypothetical protein
VKFPRATRQVKRLKKALQREKGRMTMVASMRCGRSRLGVGGTKI